MTTTQEAAIAVTAADVMVNGPEDEPTDWPAIDWRQAEDDVRRLRQRIFTASRNGDLRKVRNLQKLMLRSRANAVISVRRVTELNAGRTTAGVDGKIALLVSQKAMLVDWAQHGAGRWSPMPVRRVYIPKAGNANKRRPLGIPTDIANRPVAQAAFGLVAGDVSVPSAGWAVSGGLVFEAAWRWSRVRLRCR